MKKGKIAVLLMTLMLLTLIVACASTRTHESAGQYVDDTVITTKIKSLLAADNLLKSFQIGVETYQGVVQLSGFVNSAETAEKAVSVAKGVTGVKSVKNDLVVK